MKVQEMVEQLALHLLHTTTDGLEQEITGAYVSDLLSNVMGQAKPGNVWITLQGHQNVIAVAALANLSAVIIAGGATIDASTAEKAKEHQVLVMTSPLAAFEIAGRLYELGIRA